MVRYLDPAHGELHFTGILEELILTDEFQRLDTVKQLGLTDKVYPFAKHTRFVHSLGAAHIAGRIAKNMGLPQEDQELLQVALLLHDIGHYDFSHALEYLMPHDHEENGHGIIQGFVQIPRRESGQIAAILRKHNYDPARLVAFLTKKTDHPEFYKSILSHRVIDADRMDFLRHDTLGTGNELGTIDRDRLISQLAVDPQGRLGIREGGVAALLQFLLARNNMYDKVYLHPQTAAGEAMLRKAAGASREVAVPCMYGDEALLYRLEEQGSLVTQRLVKRINRGNRGFHVPAYILNANAPAEQLAAAERWEPAALEQALLKATGLEEGDLIISFSPKRRKHQEADGKAKPMPQFPVQRYDGSWTDLCALDWYGEAVLPLLRRPVDQTVLKIYAAPEARSYAGAVAPSLLGEGAPLPTAARNASTRNSTILPL